MKKFGTPSGAGPGSANEKVGFAGVGTPGPVGPDVDGLTPFALALAFFTWLVRVVVVLLTAVRVLLVSFFVGELGFEPEGWLLG
jgi:hypothetical protein